MRLPFPIYAAILAGRVVFYCRYAVLALVALTWGGSAAASSANRFDNLRVQQARVASVAYKLAIASRPLCRAAAAPQAGFLPHDLAQYAPLDRPGAARAYGLGSRIGVMAVASGSPAANAGLRAGDQLEAVNGRPLATIVTPEGAPTMAFVDEARRVIDEELRHGAVTLSLVSGGSRRDIHFTAALGCPSDVQLVPGADVNAWADGARVMVTDAIVARCPTDDDLALVIAHELAHNLLHHRRRLALAGLSENTLLPVSSVGLAAVRAAEVEADSYAVRMAGAAGYDLGRAASFMAGLLKTNGMAGALASTHPEARQRLALLTAAIARTSAMR
jgi:hypothetical protein